MNSVRRMLTSPRNPNAILLHLQRYYSTTRRSNSNSNSNSKLQQWPKPTEVPFQPKLANAINLIGKVNAPIQFETSSDGNPWAATVITRQEPSSLWIPVIFQGDLAHTARYHLKENDVVFVSGQLSTDPPHSQPQSHFQVMVQSFNFVKDCPQVKNVSPISKQKVVSLTETAEDDIKSSKKDIHSKQREEPEIDKSWKDLLNSPNEWWDVRSTKGNPKGAAFERKTDGELLFIDSSTPKWLQDKLESLTIKLKPEPKQSITSAKTDPESLLNSWKDLLADPKQWKDFRDSKLNGAVNPRYPDFKRKDSNVPLWLDRAPKWILSKLEGLEFDNTVANAKSNQGKESKGLEFDNTVANAKSNQGKESKGDQSWDDLVQNPTKWWDNRVDKKNPRAPDFKHKETGKALWLRGSPSWVLAKLPPPKTKQNVPISRKQSLV